MTLAVCLQEINLKRSRLSGAEPEIQNINIIADDYVIRIDTPCVPEVPEISNRDENIPITREIIFQSPLTMFVSQWNNCLTPLV